MKRIGLTALGFLFLAGCKSVPPTHVLLTPATRLPAGWTVGASRDSIVSVGIPPGWRSGVDKGADDLQGMLSSSDNPDLRKMAEDAQKDSDAQERKELEEMEKKGIVINAINSSKRIPGEARTRFYVKRTHRDGNATWGDALDSERQHYAFAPKPTEEKLPIGKALRLSADDKLRDGGTLHQISYVVIDGPDIYALRFVTEEAGETISTVAYGVANTWRIQPSKK